MCLSQFLHYLLNNLTVCQSEDQAQIDCLHPVLRAAGAGPSGSTDTCGAVVKASVSESAQSSRRLPSEALDHLSSSASYKESRVHLLLHLLSG